jgi:SAM-dependent methyltransferase
LTARIGQPLAEGRGEVAVGGTIADLRMGTDALRFALEDAAGRIDAIMFLGAMRELGFHPENGLRVVARGHLVRSGDDDAVRLDVQALEPPAGRRDRGWRALEERTRLWLEGSYREGFRRISAAPAAHRVYEPDGRIRRMTAYHFQALLRKLKVFRLLDRLRFESLVDIGSGFDIYPYLVRRRYGVPTYSADLAHWVNLPFDEPVRGKLDHAVTLSVTRLPFADNAFDVVLATEVLEHLVRPVEAISEMLRVARKYVVLTSLEALSADRWQRFHSRWHVDARKPHVERNFLVLDEVVAIFGAGVRHENLFFDPDLPVSAFAPADRQQAAYAAFGDMSSLVSAVCTAAARRDHAPGAMGIVLLAAQPGASVGSPTSEDAALAEWLVQGCAASEEAGVRLLERVREPGADLLPEPERPVALELLRRLVCPDCRGPLEQTVAGLHCERCSSSFTAEHGVPILCPRSSPSDRELEREVQHRLCGDDRQRWRTVRRLMRSLRRVERGPGRVRRLLWRVEGLRG